MTRTRAALAAAGAAGALLLTACGGGSGTATTPPASGGASGGGAPVAPSGGTFTTSIATDPGILDPQMTVLSAARGVDSFLYDTLIVQTNDGKIQQGLAEKWEATTTSAKFTLRKGIKCSDGTDVSAKTIADNINFVADAKNKSPYAGLQVVPGSTATADEATNTVTVTSKSPDAFLLVNIGSLMMPCGKGLTDRTLLSKGQSGTGMFQISEVVPNDHYTLTRRKDYTWGPGDFKNTEAGLPDKVIVKIIPSETTAANLLLSGQLNAVTIVGADKDRLLAAKVAHEDFHSTLGELWFNQDKDRPGNDPAVRKALAQALDLGQIGKVMTGGAGKASTSFVAFTPAVCQGDSLTGHVPTADPEAAKAALDAAGWKAGSDGIRVKGGKKLSMTVLYSTQLGPQIAAGAELAQQQWKAVGADVTIKGVDSPALNQALFVSGDWDAGFVTVGVNLPSMLVPFVSGPVPPQGVNFAHIDNKDYQAAVAKASTKAGADGCADWQAAETALATAVDGLPFVDTTVQWFAKGTTFELVVVLSTGACRCPPVAPAPTAKVALLVRRRLSEATDSSARIRRAGQTTE